MNEYNETKFQVECLTSHLIQEQYLDPIFQGLVLFSDQN